MGKNRGLSQSFSHVDKHILFKKLRVAGNIRVVRGGNLNVEENIVNAYLVTTLASATTNTKFLLKST